MVPAPDYTLSSGNFAKRTPCAEPPILRTGAKVRNRIRTYNDRMRHSALVLVESFATQVEADLAKSMLESAGIDAMIQADRAGGMRDHLAWSGFGFKVLVREEDADTAREVLDPPRKAPE